MKKKSLTIIEILMVTATLAMLVAILTTAVVQTRSLFQSTDILAQIQQEARQALGRIEFDLRRTSFAQITITEDNPFAGTDMLTYSVPQDAVPAPDGDGIPDVDAAGNLIWDPTAVTLRLDPAGAGDIRSLLRTHGTDVDTLAADVRRIEFFDSATDPDVTDNEIKVILEVERADTDGRVYSTVTTSIINMRN